MQSLKDLPADLRSQLNSLKQLNILLHILGDACQEGSHYVPVAVLELLNNYISNALDEVRQLASKIEKEVATLDDRTGLQREARKLGLLFKSSYNRKRFEKIQRIIQGLQLCHSEITRYATPPLIETAPTFSRRSINQAGDGIGRLGHNLDALALGSSLSNQRLDAILDDVDALRVQANEQTADMKQVLAALFSHCSKLSNRVDRFEENYKWSTSVQSSMTKELTSIIESTMQPLIGKLQRPMSARKNAHAIRESRSTLPNTAPRLTQLRNRHNVDHNRNGYSLQGLQPNAIGLKEDPLPENSSNIHSKDTTLLNSKLSIAAQNGQTQVIPEEAGCSEFDRDQRPGDTGIICYEKTTILSKTYRTQHTQIHIEIKREQIETRNISTSRALLHVSVASNLRVLKRALEADLCWDDTNGSSSLTISRLILSRVIPKEDPLISALYQDKASTFLELFKAGRYTPNDCAQAVFGNYVTEIQPLLWHCLNTNYPDLEIVVFLVQQGARCSTDTWSLAMRMGTGMFCGFFELGLSSYLNYVRTLASRYDFIESRIQIEDARVYEAVLDTISPLSNSTPEWTFTDDFETFVMDPDLENFTPERLPPSEKACFERLLRRLKPDLVSAFNFLAYWIKHDGYIKLSEEWKRSGWETILDSRIDSIIKAGLDPCHGIYPSTVPPTIEMAVDWKSPDAARPLGLQVWFNALANAGVNVSKLARHSFLSCPGDLRFVPCNWKGSRPCCFKEKDIRNYKAIGLEYPRLENADDLKRYLLQAFAACGIHTDETWFSDGDQNVYVISATVVDFVPTTMQALQHRRQRVFEQE